MRNFSLKLYRLGLKGQFHGSLAESLTFLQRSFFFAKWVESSLTSSTVAKHLN